MSKTKQPEAMATAAALETLDMGAAADLVRRQYAELETLRAGYTAARLEIESLQRRVQEVGAVARREHERADRAMRAAQPAGAQQPGAAYAALPDDRESFKTYLKECDECAIVPDVAGAFNAAWQIASHGQAPAQSEVVPECHYGPLRDADAEWGKQLSVYATLPRAADTQQAPAQAAPAAVETDPCPGCIPGGYCRTPKCGRLIAMNAAKNAAPAAVAGPSDVVSIQRQAFIRGWDERGMAHQLKGTVETDERMRALMDIYFPRTAAPTTQPAPQQEAQEPYSIDADPQGIRAIVADAITGVLAFGAQGTNAPPDGHWLAPFWAAARAEREEAPHPYPASQGDALDAARLDWLDQNIFLREMSERDAKYGHGSAYNMWVLFAPKGAQSSARNIIDAARAAQEGK